MTIRRLLVTACLVVGIAGLLTGPTAAAPASAKPRPVVVINFNRTVDEVSASFLHDSLKSAAKEKATLVVIRLDTPGGLISSMRKIVADILDSPVPVAVWVGPSGARAASAGTFLAAASAYLAMAPVTNIGAAAAVDSNGGNLDSTLARKVNQDNAALMRSLCVKRHRPAPALEETVFHARSYSAEEAVRLGIANLEVSSLNAVLKALDGKTLEASAGPVRVQTAGAPVKRVNMSFWKRLLDFLSDPNVVFLLLNVGGLGLIIELWTGGNSWIPGSLGIICLLLAFGGLSVMPFSWAGLALILVGLTFLGVELHAPGHVFFGVSGAASIIIGGVLLIGYFGGPGLPGYNPSVSWWLLGTLGVIVGLAAFVMAREVHLSHHGKRYVSSVESKALVGAIAEVNTRLAPRGEVWLNSEAWQAELEGGGTAEPGERLKVVAVKGFLVTVRPLSKEEAKKPKS